MTLPSAWRAPLSAGSAHNQVPGGGGWYSDRTGAPPPPPGQPASKRFRQEEPPPHSQKQQGPPSPVYSLVPSDDEPHETASRVSSEGGGKRRATADPSKIPAWLTLRIAREEENATLSTPDAAHSLRALAARVGVHIPKGNIRVERDGKRCIMFQLTERICRDLVRLYWNS